MQRFFNLGLQVFADGEGAPEAGKTAEVNGEAQTADVSETKKEETVETEPVDVEAEFEKLIKGKYKDAFTKRTQSIIDKRFKETKQLEAKFEKVSPLLKELSARYGKDAEDYDGLTKAFLTDDAYIEHRALEEGKDPDQLRQELLTESERRAEREELQRLRAERENARQEEERKAKFVAWYDEAQALKGVFSSLDFKAEMSNPQFITLLESLTNSGFAKPFEQAYRTFHMDEIVTTVAATAAQKVANSAATNTKRPQENGNSDSVASVSKIDVNSLSEKQIKELLKRVESGERITF